MHGVTEEITVLETKQLDKQRTQELVDEFNREGVVWIGKLLTADEVAFLKRRIDEIRNDPLAIARKTIQHDTDWSVARVFEWDHRLRDLLAREPIIGLVEAILGSDCHLIANNVICNPPGKAVDTFHSDDGVFFPLPPEIPRHDPRIVIPALAMHVFIPLTDISSEEFGPFQYVPGSHYAGRHPNDPQDPKFEGRSYKSLLANAGDVYVQHPQVWHRGAPNRSNRTRYVYSQAFGRRVYAQRFYPSLKYQMPDWVLEGASERVQRILGIHARGPYE